MRMYRLSRRHICVLKETMDTTLPGPGVRSQDPHDHNRTEAASQRLGPVLS